MTNETYEAAVAIKKDLDRIASMLVLLNSETPEEVSSSDLATIAKNLGQLIYTDDASVATKEAINTVNKTFYTALRIALTERQTAANNAFSDLSTGG